MKKTKIIALAAAVLAGSEAWAGGLLTNTNQSAAFLRNPARDGVIAIDGVYSNPAGVAFLGKGLHLSINNQSAWQTRTIRSGISVPALTGTPFENPFTLYGGSNIKEFKGEAAAPIIPSVHAALNYDNWGFQASFGVVGGGGKCTFNRGLGSFEREVALLPAIMNIANGAFQKQYGVDLELGSTKPGYSVESYIHGQQYVFGLQLGTTYKINEHWAVYGGFRFNYIYNKYEGNIKNISVNIAGENQNLYKYLGVKAKELAEKATLAQQAALQYNGLAEQANLAGNTAAAEQYKAKAQEYGKAAAISKGGAQTMESVRGEVADKYLDCTQRGWAIDPIIGVDYKGKNFNIGARLEFTTHFNIQNDTKRDDTGLFVDGVNTPGDMPGIATIGAQYDIMPQLRVMGGFHYFFDKDARMDKDKQKKLSGNTWEYNFGAEYDITKHIQASAGMQRTKYGLGNGAYLSDMSFVTSSYSYGFGVGLQVSKKVKVNVSYFWTNYEHFNKESTVTADELMKATNINPEVIGALGIDTKTLAIKNTDDFTRTNKVFGVGLDIDL